MDGSPLKKELTWIPFARSIYDLPVVYIYRKNIIDLTDMPHTISLIAETDTLVSCTNGNSNIQLTLRNGEITNLCVKQDNKTSNLPTDMLKKCIQPNFLMLFSGYEKELYIYIRSVDASEAYGIYLTVWMVK